QAAGHDPASSANEELRGAQSRSRRRSRRRSAGRSEGSADAARERGRVRLLRQGFDRLQRTLPAVPPDTKLSKLDVLLLASSYIALLGRTVERRRGMSPQSGNEVGSMRETFGALGEGSFTCAAANHTDRSVGGFPDGTALRTLSLTHPMKKWPIRARLFAGFMEKIMVAEEAYSGTPQCVSSSNNKPS
uniref:transcription factor 23-like n=1 Tax=Myxine glutinosa TaxID=7769 RepID=UPI00358F4AC8